MRASASARSRLSSKPSRSCIRTARNKSIVSKLYRVVVANVLCADTCLFKPSTKACGDAYLLLHGLRAVSLGADRIRKRYQMGCKRPFWRLRERDLIMTGVLHDDLLPRHGERVEGVKIISLRRRPFDLKSAPSRDYKT